MCEKSGRCIPKVWVCDGDIDCGDNDSSDEHDKCPKLPSCLPSEFKCANNHCISYDLYCNNENDCGDNSDELQCMDMCDSATQMLCPTDGTCIPIIKKCDGVSDCLDGADEMNCTSEIKPTKAPKQRGKDKVNLCEWHEFR